MLKEKKYFKISFLTIEILNLIEFIIGLSCFICAFIIKDKINEAFWIILQAICIISISFSTIALESGIVERIKNRNQITSKEYFKLTVSSNSIIFYYNVINVILTLIVVISMIIFLFN